jgi:ankyrin repeat protein
MPSVRVGPVNHLERPLLWLAVRDGHLDTVHRLLDDPRIDVNEEYGTEVTILIFSLYQGYEDISLALLQTRDRLDLNDINARNIWGESALCVAARRGYVSVVEAIVQYDGVDIDAADNRGNTAPFWAESSNQPEMVKILVNDQHSCYRRVPLGDYSRL